MFHLIILILLVYSSDKFSHGAKDVGGVTGLDIHRDKYGAINPDWAFDYVSNIKLIYNINKTKTKDYIHLVAARLKLLPPSIFIIVVNVVIIIIIIIIMSITKCLNMIGS